MKQHVALGLIVGLVVGVVIVLVINADINHQPAQANGTGLPFGIEYFTDRGHDCYQSRSYGSIACVNPVEVDEPGS